ncbi:MAG: B12-binding domain-containing radical SAM protein [Candidatus Omnitrophica bacterium]|nr:B12-binding domain-containing radical SAM protein [Candidatus Omnitrophota bacterium]MCM8790628.1 B12-binding domain-containing radical SAM protein [Candidatus Omnitrophota bacterium]
MHILFISSVDDIATPERPLRTPEQMQFGISYISSLLKSQGHNTELVVLSRMLGARNKTLIQEAIGRFNPRLVCFTAVTSEYTFIERAARYIKKMHPELFLLVGGAHASLNPNDVAKGPFDAICIGEGEYPTLELAEKLTKVEVPSGIQNLWIMKDGTVEKNDPRPFVKDIDGLPFPDREIWQKWISGGEDVWQPVLLGRGCPFNCTYCCNHALRRIAQGQYVRLRSVDSITREIIMIVEAYPRTKQIYLEVETIGANMAWANELCAALKRVNTSLKEPLLFGTNLRITRGSDFSGLFRLFKESNFKFVRIGVESGSERVRKEILKRDYSNNDIIRAVALARQNGIQICFYNLIGVPGETYDDFKETIAINRECLPDQAFAHIFFPYPGTELYDVCRKKELFKRMPSGELERCRAVLDLPGFPKKKIQKAFIWFDYNVYKGKRSMISLMAKTLVSKCRSNLGLHAIYRNLSCFHLFKYLKSAIRVR